MFPVLPIPSDAYDFAEQMGTKFKFWYDDPLLARTLFKEGRPATGENWAEKLACEFAMMLGIPHAYYELAQWRGRYGVLSPSFVPSSGRLIHGNEIVGGKVIMAPDDQRVRYYHEKSHTASRVLGYLKSNADTLHPPHFYVPIEGVKLAAEVFVGYLLFDAWIANQDRHSENWGVVRTKGGLYLAPSYDHGSGLARTESDERRIRMLTTKDKGASIESYVKKARSALYPHTTGDVKVKAFLTTEAFKYAWKIYPVAGNAWRERLANISSASVWDTISQVPEEHMSEAARDFTARLLDLNRDRLLALTL